MPDVPKRTGRNAVRVLIVAGVASLAAYYALLATAMALYRPGSLPAGLNVALAVTLAAGTACGVAAALGTLRRKP
jgi:hypothetical protein